MGTDKATLGATENDVTQVCSAHARIVPALFLKNVVQVPWSRDPEGVPLGVRMRNRRFHNIRPGRAFSPIVTSVT